LFYRKSIISTNILLSTHVAAR